MMDLSYPGLYSDRRDNFSVLVLSEQMLHYQGHRSLRRIETLIVKVSISALLPGANMKSVSALQIPF